MSLIVSKISKLILKTSKEHYGCDNEDDDLYKGQYKISLLDFFIIMLSCYAVYLSWSCNTVKKVDVLLKIIYAAFAFSFGPGYVMFYAIFKEKITPC